MSIRTTKHLLPLTFIPQPLFLQLFTFTFPFRIPNNWVSFTYIVPSLFTPFLEMIYGCTTWYRLYLRTCGCPLVIYLHCENKSFISTLQVVSILEMSLASWTSLSKTSVKLKACWIKLFYSFPSSHLPKKRPQKNIIHVFLIQQEIILDPV